MQAMVQTTAPQIICFFIDGDLNQKRLLNAMLNHANLNDGNLRHTVDFKEVYATV